MTVHADRKLELLKLIAAQPGIDAGLLMSRSATCRRASEFEAAAKGLLNDDGLVDRDGSGLTIRYYLTERGAGAAAEYGFFVAADAVPAGADQASDADEIPSTTEEVAAVFEELPVITAGAGEVVLEQESEPLTVIDSDRTSLDEALAQLSELVSESPRPVNLTDLIEFNRRGAELIRHHAPVPAALMESTANALERAYSQ
ncbi:hypothetical protein [Marinobacterium stanieri]|uniref:Uncharacterized protein n=1 Tax=Marinobacterium stanieri TaxID=49186 RepID=A0A1N6QCP4_9GAMM|nr:hypothetical protein [Marinobacterium stanieri]SIQ14285.1 hypothetical protein SAMN05421647_102416 [Marinobacterium stanieri]